MRNLIRILQTLVLVVLFLFGGLSMLGVLWFWPQSAWDAFVNPGSPSLLPNLLRAIVCLEGVAIFFGSAIYLSIRWD